MAKKHIWDNPKNLTRFLTVFFAFLIVILGLDFVIHRHTDLVWEEWPGFYCVYGFVACVLLVLVSKYVLRPLVKRDEDYYDV